MSIDNQDTNSGKKISHDCWTWLPDWIKANPLWAAAHILNLFAAIFLFSGATNGMPILPVVIFMCIIFVQIYTAPIKTIPADADQRARADLEEIRSEQRNKWMIFAYSFMLISLLLTFYPFINPLLNFTEKTQAESDETAQLESTEEKKTRPDEAHYLNTLRERPIAVFIGCSLDKKSENLRCEPKDEVVTNSKDGKKDQTLETSQTGRVTNNQIQPTSSAGVGYAWVINIGGYIKQCNPDGDGKYGKSFTCEVKDGLLIPLYFIIMALMGGSISLTRRLPELQKQAGSEHIGSEKQPKLSQYEFREYLIFQMVQFISAPFLAILAYYLVDPSDTTSSVALAFTAGFASESILLMIRSVANKITPETGAGPQYGAVAGVVTLSGKGAGSEEPAQKVEVSLSESPQIQSITDDKGFYMLGNVPVGEHSISIKFTTKVNEKEVENIKKVTVKIERAQAIVKKNVTIESEPGQ